MQTKKVYAAPRGNEMDAFTAQHFAAWLDRVVPEDEQDATRDSVLALVAADSSVLDGHSWSEIRRLAEAR